MYICAIETDIPDCEDLTEMTEICIEMIPFMLIV